MGSRLDVYFHAFISIQPGCRREGPTQRKWGSHLYVKPHLHVAKLPQTTPDIVCRSGGAGMESKRGIPSSWETRIRHSVRATNRDGEKRWDRGGGERGKGKLAIPGSTNSIRFTEQKQLAKLAKLLRDARGCYYASPNANFGIVAWWRSTHDSLDKSSRSWTLGVFGRYVSVMIARKEKTWRIEVKVCNSLLHV